MASFKETLNAQKFQLQGFMDPNKYYETWSFDDDETIRRVWDKEQLKNIVGRRAFYAANDQRDREINELWVTKKENRDTACLGANWGYHIGLDKIRKVYVDDYAAKQHEMLDKLLPGADSNSLGYGCSHFVTATTPLLRLSGDGKTARGLWYCIGQDTRAVEGGEADAWWIYQTMGIDFIKEDGQWKIWHLVECIDYVCQAGISFQAGDVDGIPEEQRFRDAFGKPDIEMTVHDPRYNWYDDFPGMPMPYYSFTPENGYGPEGNPYYKRFMAQK